jgi:hypothetical protein
VNIDAAEIQRLVAQREGRQLEFKQGLPRDEKIARSLAAFANTRGGILLVGVGDRGELFGAPRPAETQRRLREVAMRELEPPLDVLTGCVEVQGWRIVWCSVPLSPARPHSVARGDQREVPVRVGSSNRSASGATLAAIRAQRGPDARLDPLQKAVLVWLAGQRDPSTPAAFANARNVGIQRARRAFTQLEVAGRLVGHGHGARRSYALA